MKRKNEFDYKLRIIRKKKKETRLTAVYTSRC